MISDLADTYKKNKHYILFAAILFASLLLFQLTYSFEYIFSRMMSSKYYLAWHTVLEYIATLVAFAVFFISYYSYDQTRNLRSAFLGGSLLATGIVDILHTLSYKGMPSFVVENQTSNRATTYWIILSLIFGMGFFIASFIPLDKKTYVRKELFLLPPLAVGFLSFTAVDFFPGLLPTMYIEGYGLTATKIALEYVTIGLVAVAMIRFIHEYRKTGESLSIKLSYALLVEVFSHLAFTVYIDVYGIHNYLGHIYQFISFFIVFSAIFIFNVRKPYIELSEAKNELKSYAGNLDKLVNQRTLELKNTNKKLLDDLAYAMDIQKAMLPAKLPEEEEVSFDARYFPAEHVSGDFYNVFKLDENSVGFYIGDVSGHGVSAAMLTVFLNQTIKTIKENDQGEFEILKPSIVLSQVYKSFNKAYFKEEVYIVMLYAIYNFKMHELTCSSAGINVAPIIIRNSGELEELKISGFPICKFIEFFAGDYTDYVVKMEEGEKLVMYTDGLIEAENLQGEYFSEERLGQVLSLNHKLDVKEFSKTISKEIKDFVNGKELKDDITFLVMQAN